MLCAALLSCTVKEIRATENSFLRFTAPGEATFEFTKPGDYTVFFEHKGAIDGVAYITPKEAAAGLALSIEGMSDGARIPIAPAASNTTYSLGAHEGSSLFSFHIDRPGSYRFIARAPSRGDAGPIVLAIGNGLAKEIFRLIVALFALVFAFLLTIAIPTVVIAVNASKKRGPAAGAPYRQ